MRLLPSPPVPEAPVPEGRRQSSGLTRRQVLRWGLAGGTAALLPVSLPGCGDDGEPVSASSPLPTPTPASAEFLSPSERRTLAALLDHWLPSDEEGPGALECGADEYLDRLLARVPDEADPGAVFAGGPFSGRNPFPDYDSGTPSNRFPDNDFVRFVPLNRLQRIAWRARILGSAAVPDFDFNAEVLGQIVGLRAQVRLGLAELEDLSQAAVGKSFSDLTAEERTRVLGQADSDFLNLVLGLALEGMFSVPEYGGNRGLRGWALIGFGGDSQPLGYSIFDRTAGVYRERSEAPNSAPDPDESFSPFPDELASLLRLLVRLAGAPRFP